MDTLMQFPLILTLQTYTWNYFIPLKDEWKCETYLKYKIFHEKSVTLKFSSFIHLSCSLFVKNMFPLTHGILCSDICLSNHIEINKNDHWLFLPSFCTAFEVTFIFKKFQILSPLNLIPWWFLKLELSLMLSKFKKCQKDYSVLTWDWANDLWKDEISLQFHSFVCTLS